MRNVEEILRLADYIERTPNEMYNQSMWAEGRKSSPCGTAYCIAGHQVCRMGYSWRTTEDADPQHAELLHAYGPDWRTWFDPERQHVQGEIVIQNAAAEALGLTREEANIVFDGDGGCWPGEFGDRFVRSRDEDATENPKDVAVAFLRAIAANEVALVPRHRS